MVAEIDPIERRESDGVSIETSAPLAAHIAGTVVLADAIADVEEVANCPSVEYRTKTTALAVLEGVTALGACGLGVFSIMAGSPVAAIGAGLSGLAALFFHSARTSIIDYGNPYVLDQMKREARGVTLEATALKHSFENIYAYEILTEEELRTKLEETFNTKPFGDAYTLYKQASSAYTRNFDLPPLVHFHAQFDRYFRQSNLYEFLPRWNFEELYDEGLLSLEKRNALLSLNSDYRERHTVLSRREDDEKRRYEEEKSRLRANNDDRIAQINQRFDGAVAGLEEEMRQEVDRLLVSVRAELDAQRIRIRQQFELDYMSQFGGTPVSGLDNRERGIYESLLEQREVQMSAVNRQLDERTAHSSRTVSDRYRPGIDQLTRDRREALRSLEQEFAAILQNAQSRHDETLHAIRQERRDANTRFESRFLLIKESM